MLAPAPKFPPLTFPLLLLVGASGVGALAGGWRGVYVVGLLAVLEVAMSFDNAIVNASVLKRLDRFWQLMFLTVGLVVAVLGMRLVFPVALVAVSAHLPWGAVVNLALHNPAEYSVKLQAARPAIAAFGATFLMMLFLDFVLDDTKTVHWIGAVERPLAQAGRLRLLPVLVVLVGLSMTVLVLAPPADSAQVLAAGLAGLAVYLAVRLVTKLFVGLEGKTAGRTEVAGMAGLVLFLYLIVLDSAFSFDSAIGAFAISTNVLMIALGLSVGAAFMRDLTLLLVRKHALDRFAYLEHGAQYAMGALAVILALGLAFDIPELVTGLVGAGFIALALASSVRENRRLKTSIDPPR